MKLKYIAVIAILALSACSTTSIDSGLKAQQGASQALNQLNAYIGEDEIAINALVGPVASLQNLYERSIGIDSSQAFYEFFTENQSDIMLASKNWGSIAAAVNEYSRRTKTPIPSEVLAWNRDVQKAWKELGEIVAAKSKTEKVVKYTAMLAKIVASSHGVKL